MPDIQNLPDFAAIDTQINVLKQQRSIAMDDVAVLLGRLESKSKAYDELLRKYNECVGTAEAGQAQEAAPTDQSNST